MRWSGCRWQSLPHHELIDDAIRPDGRTEVIPATVEVADDFMFAAGAKAE